MQLRLILILILTVINPLYSQVKKLQLSYSEDVIIESLNNHKIPVFVFVRDEGDFDDTMTKDYKYQQMILMLDVLKNKNIDFDLFDIHQISIKKMKTCPPNKKMSLSNYNLMEASFVYEPYRILLMKTNNKYLDSILDVKLSVFVNNEYDFPKNKNLESSPFIEIDNYVSLSHLIYKPIVFLNDYLLIKKKYDTLKYEFQKIEKKIEENNIILNKSHKYISFLSAPINGFNYTKLFNSDVLELSNKKFSSFEINYTDYLIGSKNKFGMSIGISHNSLAGSVKLKSQNTTITDVVQKNVFDANGDIYNRIAYSSGNIEKFNFINVGLSFGLSYKEKITPKSNIVFTTSLKLNNYYYSKYKSVAGNVTFGGIYNQYNPEDTMFSGQFDFYENKNITKENQEFNLNSFNISSLNTLYYSHKIHSFNEFNNLSFNIGFNSEISSVILSNSDKNKKLISNDLNTYNSMLYRLDKVSLFNLNFILGLSLSL